MTREPAGSETPARSTLSVWWPRLGIAVLVMAVLYFVAAAVPTNRVAGDGSCSPDVITGPNYKQMALVGAAIAAGSAGLFSIFLSRERSRSWYLLITLVFVGVTLYLLANAALASLDHHALC